jgi:TonB family protein
VSINVGPMTNWCDVRAIGLATLSFVLVGSANGEDKRAGCDFSAYRPLKIGTPIRGGHEDLAVERPTPVYPRQARLKGIGGRVIVYVLINRAGDVVRTCSMGSAPLTTSAEEAVSKWKFQKDFGFDFAKPSSATPQYAELRITFDFDPQATTEGQVRAGLSVEPSPCAQRGGSAIDENGAYVWLTSDDLMRRVIAKQGLAFPMLGHGHLRGEVKLDLRIDAGGSVACAHAISGHPIAISSALTAIQGWKFRPFVRDGKSLSVLGHLTISHDVAR